MDRVRLAAVTFWALALALVAAVEMGAIQETMKWMGDDKGAT